MHKLQQASNELATRLAGRLRLQYIERCPSTNALLRELAGTGDLVQPLLLCTDEQSAGRGTRGRGWEMQPGLDLAFSLGLPLSAGLQPSPRLPLALAVIVAQCLANLITEQWRSARIFSQTEDPASWGEASPGEQVSRAINAARDGLAARLCAVKWPNDLLLAQPGADGELSYRKCGGILVELLPQALLIGIGLNVNSTAADFPQELRQSLSTVRDCCGLRLDREALFSGLVMRLFGHFVFNGILSGFSSTDDSAISALAPAWQALDQTVGSRWQLQREGASTPVQARRVDYASGSLLVEDAAGVEYRVESYSELERLS